MKAVVLADRLGYFDEDGVRQTAVKGDEVDLPADDFARHEAHGSVAKPGKAAQEALADEPVAADASTE